MQGCPFMICYWEGKIYHYNQSTNQHVNVYLKLILSWMGHALQWKHVELIAILFSTKQDICGSVTQYFQFVCLWTMIGVSNGEFFSHEHDLHPNVDKHLGRVWQLESFTCCVVTLHVKYIARNMDKHLGCFILRSNPQHQTPKSIMLMLRQWKCSRHRSLVEHVENIKRLSDVKVIFDQTKHYFIYGIHSKCFGKVGLHVPTINHIPNTKCEPVVIHARTT